jgi:hypothetical protein
VPSKFAYLSLCRSMQLLVLLARGEAAKDLEILVLRHQLAVLRRQAPRPRFQPADRALPAAISRSLPDRAHWSCFLVRPETLLRWHRRLVAGAWTSPHRRTGRPPLDQKLQQLIVQVHLAGVTSNPDGVWVAKQARNLLLVPGERGRRVHFLVRDRDARFCRGFDDVFGSQGRQVLVTPVLAPRANAYAERWVRTVRAECLDWLLLVGRGHLEQVLRVYAQHYNGHRPHRSLGLEPPDPPADLRVIREGWPSQVQRRDLLGGLLHEYHPRAA